VSIMRAIMPRLEQKTCIAKALIWRLAVISEPLSDSDDSEGSIYAWRLAAESFCQTITTDQWALGRLAPSDTCPPPGILEVPAPGTT